MSKEAPLWRGYLWLVVPVFAWGGILAGPILTFSPPFLSWGSLGCVLASFAIALLAIAKTRKDIVSLCVPLFAIIIFIVPLEAPPGLPMQVLYAVTLTALVIRLEKRFT